METAENILYGNQTHLGIENFGPGRRRLCDVPELVRNYAWVKIAAARANGSLGILDPARATAVETAAHEVVEGLHDEQFPTAVVLGGGGTTTNMNFNEVLAARASQIAGMDVHPNDHVNLSQSTNDTYPTAVALTVLELSRGPLTGLDLLIASFEEKVEEYSDTVRLGRTCLQDAVTLTTGQTHRSHISALQRVRRELSRSVEQLLSLPLGATVLGTGIGAVDGYRDAAVAELAQLTSRPLRPSTDLFDSLAHLDPYSAIASAAARASMTMAKIAADLRLLSSGPNGGLAEVELPSLQAGSSIMPGKVNPVVPEFVMQLSYRVRGAAHTVEAAVVAGELELNVMEPVIVDALIDIFEDVESAARTFAERCVAGLQWTGSRLHSNAAFAFDRPVELATRVGYDEATRLLQQDRDGMEDGGGEQ